MPSTSKSHIVKVTGVPEDLLRLLDARVKERHAAGRAEYIRELIRRDVLPEATFRTILAPVHKQARHLPDTEDELEAFFTNLRNEVYEQHAERS